MDGVEDWTIVYSASCISGHIFSEIPKILALNFFFLMMMMKEAEMTQNLKACLHFASKAEK